MLPLVANFEIYSHTFGKIIELGKMFPQYETDIYAHCERAFLNLIKDFHEFLPKQLPEQSQDRASSAKISDEDSAILRKISVILENKKN